MRHVIHTTFIVPYAFLMRQASLSINKLVLVLHNNELLAILLPILCIIWPVCVSETEKKSISEHYQIH